MLIRKISLLFFILALLVSSNLYAQQVDVFRGVPLPVRDRINLTIAQFYKDSVFVEKITDIGQVYEVTCVFKGQENKLFKRRDIFYVTKDGKFAILGSLIGNKYNTFIAKTMLEKIDVDKIDDSLAVKIKRGEGLRTLYIFTHPNCLHSKNMLNFLKTKKEYDNVVINVFFFVSEESNPNAAKAVVKSLCAKDVSKSVEKLLYEGIEESDALLCEEGKKRLDSMNSLATFLGVNRTPTFITGDGWFIEGANMMAVTKYLYEGNSFFFK